MYNFNFDGFKHDQILTLYHLSQILHHYKLHYTSQLLKKMKKFSHHFKNISPNINHKPSTNQKIRPRTFNF
jgi:hypothetical protein